MDNHILNDVKRNRELMGIVEQTGLNEQGFIKSALDGLKKGLNKNSETSTNTEDDLGDYNGKPIVEILKEIDDSNIRYGKIDVNGETLYYGVGLSSSIEISRSKAESNARIAMADDLGEKTQSNNVTTTTQTQKGVSTVIDELFQTDEGTYKRYILIKQL